MSIQIFKPYKAPGPDGCHPFFFQKFLRNTLPAISNLFTSIFNSEIVHSSLNQTFLSLIPKTNSLETINFVQLVSTILFTKFSQKFLLLRPFLNQIINPLQSSFLPSRRASDNFIIVQETLNFFHKCKNNHIVFMAIKINLEKAFDKIEWNFICNMMHSINM